MTLSKSLQNVASKVMAKLGGNVTIQFVSLGTYNPTTGEAAETITTDEIKGVLDDVNASEVNELVRGDDKKLTVAAKDTTAPGLDDKVLIGDVVHQIVRVETIEQDNEAIVYQLFLRA